MNLAYFGRSKCVQSWSQAKKYHFWASFLNYTGSGKGNQNLAYVFIPKGETNKT